MINDQEIRARISKFLKELAFEVSSARVFITLHDPKTELSFSLSEGIGNFHAQYGQIEQWIVRQKQYVINDAINEDKEEGGEDE